MRAYLVRAHSYAMTSPNKFLLAVGASIVFTVLVTRDPVLAVSMVLAIAAFHFMRTLYTPASRFNSDQMILSLFGAFCVFTAMLPETAHAAGGFAAWARALKAQFTDIYDAFIYGAYGVGLVCACIGVNNGIKKSKGDQQVTTASIFGYGLGGPVLMMVGYFADSAAESVGGGAGQMNRLPGGL